MDILSDIKKIPKCSIIQKNKKVCNRDSTIYENVNGTIIGYCNRHKKNCKAEKYCYAGCSDIKKIPIFLSVERLMETSKVRSKMERKKVHG